MYNIWQIVKPNGEKLAWLDEEQATTEAVELSKKVGADQVIYHKLECEEDEGDQPGKEWVVQTRTYSNGEVISENEDRYEAPSYVPAPSKSKKKGGKTPKTPEEIAAAELEKANKKAAKDAAKDERAKVRAAAKAERDAAREERRKQRELDKANRPAAGSRSRLPDDGIIHMLRDTNPKRPGSAAHPRFALYEEGMAVKAYKELNKDFGSADLAWDIDHGFIRVTKADGSPLETPAPVADEIDPTEDADGQPTPSAEDQGEGVPA